MEAVVGIALALGALVALATFVTALFEYVRQGRQKRVEHFFDLRRRLKDNSDFAVIAALLDHANAADLGVVAEAEQELAPYDFQAKRNYVGLFEEVALALNSGLIKTEVAHYMFGYYAILCWETRAFWANLNQLSPYWALMESFYRQMKEQSEHFEFDASDFRF